MSATVPVPVLTGDLVRLRPHTLDDLDAVLERCLDPDTIRWTTVPSPYDAGMAREYLTEVVAGSETDLSWAIDLDGAYAGTIDLRGHDCDAAHGAGSLGFVTHPAARRRGVMTEAIRLAVAHALDTLGWELIVWQGNLGNVASYKAAWRNGFPAPVAVPALLAHRGRMRDGWHSTLERGAPRTPSLPWAKVSTRLAADLAVAARPG